MDLYTAPQYGSVALVTIDLQRCTLEGQSFEVPGTNDVIPNVSVLAREFRGLSRPIVHVIRLYRSDGSNAELCRRADLQAGASLVVVGTEGRKPVADILPQPDIEPDDERLLAGDFQEIGPNEWLMYKPRWGAFYGTELEQFLRDLNVTTVVIAGCNYPNCPRATLYEASERDFRLVAVTDGISRLEERGAYELKSIGVAAMDTSSCIDALRDRVAG